MSEYKPRLALDMYVLAQGVRTGVYRVCDELFVRLAASPRFDCRLLIREGDQARVADYVETKGLRAGRAARPTDADILFLPFGVAPHPWQDDAQVLRAHLVHDLIAIHRPDYFSLEASTEVRSIIASLDRDTVIFTVSEHTRKELLACRPDLRPEQVTVMSLAAGAWFRPCEDGSRKAAVRARYGIPAGFPYVLSLATLEIRKNLDHVVKAFVRFLELNPASAMRLVLAGMSGWKLDKLNEALAGAGAWRDRIILTGFVDDAELSPLYSDATCFIYLSRYEGFGLPPLEAMACGTPVICADNSSLPEVVGDAGISVDADDVEGAAQAIQRIAASEALREEFARKGLQRARLFDWDRSAATVADTLDAAYARHVAQPSSYVAGLSGYKNGSKGPSFAATGLQAAERHAAGWPLWCDALPDSSAARRAEGGLRLQGRLKSGSAEQPLVSYVTVVRNNTATLARTLESVQQQTYPNVEHIVLDGASTDGTLDLIEQYADRLDYFASEPDAGLYEAINKAVPLARGQLICILNSDDWLEPQAAEIAVRRLRNQSEAVLLLTTAYIQVGTDRPEWLPGLVHPGCYFTCANDCHNGIYASRAAYERSGPYDTAYRIVADFKWIMRCLEAGVSFVYTKEPTVNYSLGGTSGDVRQHSIECMRVVRERFPFLSSAEVSGLYHSFFLLAGPVAAQQGDRPPHFTSFLRALFVAHVGQDDFLDALSWAAMSKLEHPVDVAADHAASAAESTRSVLSFKRLLLESIKTLLQGHPALYAAAQRGYLWLRGR